MDKKTIIAILFSLAFILAWDKYVIKRQITPEVDNTDNQVVEKSVTNQEKTNPFKNETKSEQSKKVEKEKFSVIGEESKKSESIEESEFILENNEVIYTFTNKGAVVKSVVMKNYKDKKGKNIEFVNTEMARRGLYPFGFKSSSLFSAFNNRVFKTTETEGKLVFRYETANGFVEKNFELTKGYVVKFSVNTNIAGNVEVSLGPGIMNAEKVQSRYSGIEDQIVLYTDGVEKYKKKKIKKNLNNTLKASWGAVEDRYFAKLVDDFKNGVNFKFDIKTYKEGDKEYELSDLIFVANSGVVYDSYLGPKQYETLKQFDNHYEKLVDFGFFGLFGKWLFFLLRWLNKFVGNYGWSIVLMTIMIRVVLFPLNQMSMKSMKRMGELQPKIKGIQAKYKKYGSDNTMKMKMNQEVAALYKEEGVNPAGGCLPMLIQMPVFFAIWGVLLSLIDLKNAEFIFWITDLSARDPYYILPVMMGATQFISQLITPSTGDKNQKMMMYAMPVVITAMLAKAPSGLMVYWTTNNLFQMIQQFIINFQLKKEKS